MSDVARPGCHGLTSASRHCGFNGDGGGKAPPRRPRGTRRDWRPNCLAMKYTWQPGRRFAASRSTLAFRSQRRPCRSGRCRTAAGLPDMRLAWRASASRGFVTDQTPDEQSGTSCIARQDCRVGFCDAEPGSRAALARGGRPRRTPPDRSPSSASRSSGATGSSSRSLRPVSRSRTEITGDRPPPMTIACGLVRPPLRGRQCQQQRTVELLSEGIEQCRRARPRRSR